ncbi:hypothetical protein QCE47_08370 [Caballeronia sp. LZ025]|jgi:hypothetical protein|uniref:hypothetical protein n=1 Tax=Caballeronia TaxID=1827195 RepID=UPI001FD1DEA2|nr:MULTISPECIES: hypothetical protein [Caballeronia]MDR5732359.1 hypothetical protein [Caballeronia sp. LZ025]
MPIVLALIALGALIYGAVWSFDAINARFGLSVAIGVALAVAAAIAAGVAFWLARRREIAPNLPRIKGDDGAGWTHELAREWGGVRLAAGKRLLDVRVGEARGSYIFADLRGARADESSGWHVLLDVVDPAHGQWRLPMRNRAEARQWARILSLAVQQKL